MNVYEEALKFKRKYPGTVARRIKRHCKVIENHLNPDEKVLYVFLGQKNNDILDLFNTAVFVLTDKRLLIATDRLVYGYFLHSITPDMFNDLNVYSGLIWGKVCIDTIKEKVFISNLSKKSLDEIETNITKYMMEQKKEYGLKKENN